jgi:cytochrome c553
MHLITRTIGYIALALGCAWAADGPAAPAGGEAARIDFGRQIRPLLSDRCFACHGPDENSRKARLRLDQRDGVLAVNRSGRPIVQPGDPAASELIRRIDTEDPDDLMPPPESKLSLTSAEKELLRRWVAQGAEYQTHWAFVPVGPVKPPGDGATPWGRNAIDAFVLERWQREGLEPSPEADRETLIRRLSFDLTGLPPSLAEVDAFLADESPAAYERVVDRLLASPHYGEWMAVEWLDLARYADTYGYQADVDVDLSPWRDWVIRAFNDNLPFDQFLTWQLAGDRLPHATRDQRLATAFNRLHRQTNEGGSIEAEYRLEYVADRVHTFGTAMLGLTLECARCHDHKYDPISQRDYYRLSAFFNSVDESGLYSHFTRATPTPVLLLWPEGVEAQHRALRRQIAAQEESLAARRRAAATSFEASAVSPEAGWDSLASPEAGIPLPAAHFAFESLTNNTSPGAATTNIFAQLHDGPESVAGRFGRGLKFSGDNSAVIQGVGGFRRTDPFSFACWLLPTMAQDRAVVFHGSRSWTDSGSRGYELVLEEGRPFFALIHFWPGNALAVRAREPLPLGEWSHLTITYDGSSRAAGLRLYRNGLPLATDVVRDQLYKDIRHRAEWGDADVGQIRLTLAGRFRDRGFKDGLMDEFMVFNTELTPLEAAWLAHAAPGAEHPPELPAEPVDRAAILEHRLARLDAGYQEGLAELRRLREAEDDLITPVREIMTMEELPTPRPAHVLRRGAYDAPGERVERGTPDAVLPWPPTAPRDRLGLAAWVTDPQNPLTARVAVNRVWKLHFGRGLVATTWDFGAQGEAPSHPELLDWLARRFVESGWDRKALHKHVVMSATYQQSSVADGVRLARDPDNRWLSRGPKHRLAAEQIRDQALAASGLLNPVIGGPSVKPYQPPGVWEESGTGKTYQQDTGDKLYRRSLYTFWRRTAPPPSMLSFDATTREVCTAKREVTATPLQALVLLNDVQFVEAARVLAEHLVARHPTDPAARAREAFRRLAGRGPDAREAEILARLYAEQLEWFGESPEAAAHFLAVGASPRQEALPAVEVAATAVLASAVMNFDAFVMKR